MAAWVVLQQLGLPIPTTLSIALINEGVLQVHLEQARMMSDKLDFIRGALTTSEDQLLQLKEDGQLSEDDYDHIVSIRELLTPNIKDAISEEIQQGTDGLQ